MPMERMPMRHVRDCVRLKNAGMSTREIARRVEVASSTVRLTLRRCDAAGIVWPLEANLTDAMLEQRLFANAGANPAIGVMRSPIGLLCIARCDASTSPCRFFGKNISAPIPAAIATPGFANSIAALNRSCRQRCGRRMRLASGCSSITRATA